MEPTRSRFDRIEWEGVRRSRGIQRFAEKRVLGWFESHGVAEVDPRTNYRIRFQRQVPGHQIICQITLESLSGQWTSLQVAGDPFHALDSCLSHLVPLRAA